MVQVQSNFNRSVTLIYMKNLAKKEPVQILQAKCLQAEAALRRIGKQLPTSLAQKTHFFMSLIQSASSTYVNRINGKEKVFINASADTLIKSEDNYANCGGLVVRMLFEDLYLDSLKQPILKDVSNQALQRVVMSHQGQDSIPGFPSIHAFMSLILPHLEALRRPAIQCIDDIHTYLRVLWSSIAQQHFGKYEQIMDQIIQAAEQYFSRQRTIVEQIVEANLDSEINFIFTSNQQYNQQRTRLIPKARSNPRGTTLAENKRESFNQQMRDRVQSYYKVVVRNLGDIIPKNIGHLLVRHSQDNLEWHIIKRVIVQNSGILDRAFQSELAMQERKQLKQKIFFLKKSIATVKQQKTE